MPDDSGIPESPASGFTCPDCGGALWELEDGELVRYQCRTGHAFSTESLFSEQAEALDGALWAALRALEERAHLGRRLAARLRSRGSNTSANRFQQQAEDAERRAGWVRRALAAAQAERELGTPPDTGTAGNRGRSARDPAL